MTEEEDWRDIPGFEGKYQASSLGRIRSLDREVHIEGDKNRHHVRKYRGRILTTTLNKNNGYLATSLGGESSQREVHRFVAWTFLGAQEDGYQVNHINGIKTDNRVENLEYVTSGENRLHALIVLGKYGYLRNSKLSKQQVLDIYQRLLDGQLTQDVAKEFGVERHAVSDIKTRKRWGYITKHLPDIPKIHWRHKEKR